MSHTKIFVASAGTGKTTTLMNLLSTCLEETAPGNIAFTTFTKAGAQEAIDRALVKNPKCSIRDLEGFSTLHALCYRRIPRKQMLTRADYQEFGELIDVPMTGNIRTSGDGFVFNSSLGNQLLYLDSLMRNLCTNAESVIKYQLNSRVNIKTLQEFHDNYKTYRSKISKYDFTDQLEVFVAEDATFDFDYVFVDEAQDLSPLQWKAIDVITKNATTIYVAGDDKQSIYKFAGGDPQSLINMDGERTVLDTSYRLPKPVLEYSEKIAEQISQKQEYSISSAVPEGKVEQLHSIIDLDTSQGTWFFLCRNKIYMSYFEDALIKKKSLFVSASGDSWFNQKQVDYIILWEKLRRGYKFKAATIKELYKEFLPTGRVVKRGFKKLMDAMPDEELFDKDQLVDDFGLQTTAKWNLIFKLPDITKELLLKAEEDGKLENCCDIEINTIHGTKGREADNVVVLPDVTDITYKAMLDDPDNEHRVFYVATTRARQNLYIHTPITNRFYKLPQV
jgi:superfamily I DNA/RNA helicase|tara:strand:- start:36 stop:1550 length:1515 start_codon:yes stop_codon:yes gene_type:complete